MSDEIHVAFMIQIDRSWSEMGKEEKAFNSLSVDWKAAAPPSRLPTVG